MTKNIFSTIGVHAALWLFLLLLPVLSIAPFIIPEQTESSQRFYLMFAYSSIVLLLIFYVNYFLLFPRFYLSDKRIIYFLLIVLTIVIVAILTRFTIVKYSAIHESHSKPKSIFIAYVIFRILLAFFVSGALVLYERWHKSERERLHAEVSFLKAQINPHFLFNTLNGIYTFVLKKSDKAAESVSKLSALMQYVATDATKEKVSLENEINYISNYIELQKLRLTNTTQVNFSIEGNPSALQIEPLLLITFIENAFKYGVSTERESGIQITMTIKEGNFRLDVRNSKSHNKTLENNKSGIGLENTINRLHKSYPNLHTLNIIDEKESYTVNLFLQLK